MLPIPLSASDLCPTGDSMPLRRVMPRDYKRVLQAIALAERDADVDKAIMAAAHG